MPEMPIGLVTNSKTAPFPDKLMMYCIYLLSNFSLGGQSFGAGFSLRNDLDVKFAIFAKDVFEYTREVTSQILRIYVMTKVNKIKKSLKSSLWISGFFNWLFRNNLSLYFFRQFF